MTENRLEDRSSQWEATKRSVGLSTARVVDAQSHRDQYQRRWTGLRVTGQSPGQRFGRVIGQCDRPMCLTRFRQFLHTAYHWYQKQMRRASIILIYFCGTVERQTDSRTSPLHITYYWVSCKYQHQNDMKISSSNCARVNSWIHGQLKSHSDPESLKLLTRKCNCNSRVMRTSCVDVAQLLTEYLSTD